MANIHVTILKLRNDMTVLIFSKAIEKEHNQANCDVTTTAVAEQLIEKFQN